MLKEIQGMVLLEFILMIDLTLHSHLNALMISDNGLEIMQLQ